MAGGIVKRPQLETVDNYAELFGPFNYKAGTLTAGTIVIAGQIVSIHWFAPTTDSSFNIDGGDTVTIHSCGALDWSPRTRMQNPTMIIWLSGSLEYFVEYTA